MSNREHCATCGQPDNCGDCNHRGMSAENIKVGQTIEVTLPGVREWRIPPTVSTATVTAENIEALRADVAEQIERGGATLRVLTEDEVGERGKRAWLREVVGPAPALEALPRPRRETR